MSSLVQKVSSQKHSLSELSRCEERRSDLVSDFDYSPPRAKSSSLDGPSTDGADGMGRSSRGEAGSLGDGISPPLEPLSFLKVLPHLMIDWPIVELPQNGFDPSRLVSPFWSDQHEGCDPSKALQYVRSYRVIDPEAEISSRPRKLSLDAAV